MKAHEKPLTSELSHYGARPQSESSRARISVGSTEITEEGGGAFALTRLDLQDGHI